MSVLEVPHILHAEVLHSAPSRLPRIKSGVAPQDEGGMGPRSPQHRESNLLDTVLRGNADCVGIAPQDEGFTSCRQPRQQSGALG